MQKHSDITQQRLQKFAPLIRERVYGGRASVTLSIHSAPGRITYSEAVRGKYRPTQISEHFGPLWSTHWFKVDIEVPSDWNGAEVHLLWDSSSEACVWQDGMPMQGLTGSVQHPFSADSRPIRPQYRLMKSARGGERMTLYVEMACNSLFGADDDQDQRTLRQVEIAMFDREAWDLLLDFVIVADMAKELPAGTPRAGQALFTANQMVNLCDLNERKTWHAARAVAAKFLAARNGDSQHNLSAIGHAHIDTAWLWPLAETHRKCYRTFATALRYMDDYPDYKFVCSQAQQLVWMKEFQPALYEKIQACAKEGRFVPAGGTWVEPDCNIPSGESLVRQFLYGQLFFQKEFGVTCREFWNPDVFGYCAQLPQIMRGVGIRYFLTQKLSWNQFNKPTSHTFLWEGLDGSRVLTHFPPADTYNGNCSVKELLFNVKNFKDHDRANESYYLFGYGDGGGGPTIEMLERLQRVRDLDGLPRIEQRPPSEFFARCEADIKDPTVWVGELYFEFHRGTYTTQARNKLNNRRCETLLHDVEFLSALAHAQRKLDYPRVELERLWKLVLLNQFHDIIPGSSICEVYEDSEAQYRDVLDSADELRQRAIESLLPAGANFVAINTLGFPRTEVVEVADQFAVVSAPAMGYAITEPVTAVANPVTVSETDDAIVLENKFIRATLRRNGHLVSLFDKRVRRETIEAGAAANHFVLFDDEPNNWDAWDTDVFHLEKRYEIETASSMRVAERDPLRASIEVNYEISSTSRLRQTISLDALSARLEFANEVDWHERHKFLKVEFPLNIRSDNATYEVQFGHLQRPTHFNTSWDLARFEVPAQKWADLSEPDFGVALLNDCKYGYATHGNVMRLSLLRSPKHPDPQADMGRHAFRYAMLPHVGSFREAGIIEEAHRFNVPLCLKTACGAPASASFFGVDHHAVVIDTIKKAEASDAIIVRLYEAHGTHSRVRFTSTLSIRAVSRCNLLEEDDGLLSWVDGGVELELSPFQILTLKLEP